MTSKEITGRVASAGGFCVRVSVPANAAGPTRLPYARVTGRKLFLHSERNYGFGAFRPSDIVTRLPIVSRPTGWYKNNLPYI